jgi:hypothetical protein
MSRYLDLNAKELTNLTRQQYLDSIRASEGRVVGAYVCPKSVNYVEKVSNIELVASFGADFITLEGYDLKMIQMPGLSSKSSEDDFAYREALQANMGFGWTVRELKELVGRPIGTLLMIPQSENDNFGLLYDKGKYSKEMLEFVMDEGYDFVLMGASGFDAQTMVMVMDTIRKARKIVGDRLVIEAGIPHGPGTAKAPYDLTEIITTDTVRGLAQAGADIIDMPAVGIVPGFTQEYVSALVKAAHEEKALASCMLAHSMEGADAYTVKRLVIDNKICGYDIINVSAGGVYEAVALPETLMDICIAAKGKRHTYRRMCQSPMHG